jgi:5-methylphenazine-1-carboxylate 1-monooxygenase
VVGAGIGGLTTALSLHAVGIRDVLVLESTAEIRPLGVGINLLPHAVRELTELGLGDSLSQVGVATAELAYFDRHGSQIWSEPRGMAAGYKWPQYSVHRGFLQLMLLDAVQDRMGVETVQCGSRVIAATDSDQGAEVHWSDGQREHVQAAEVVVAADGIHSAVRAQWHPDEGPPEWSGAVLWRGTSLAPSYLTGRSMIMAGHRDVKFVAYPITYADDNGHQQINWIAERRAPDEEFAREDWNRQVDTAVFADYFAEWSFPWLDIPSVIDAAPAVFEYPMVDRLPLSAWTRGRTTLLGDAAHPTYPIGSNGSSQAIVDARVLAHSLATKPIDAALSAYVDERLPPTRAVMQANRGMGPEIVMQIAHERAPDGFDSVEEVFAPGELAATAAEYKRIAGFDPEALNARPSWTPA